MSEEASKKTSRGRWRDDPLSVFLAVGAVLLGGMYLLEQRDATVLEEASTRAKQLGATTLDLAGCTTASASTDGRTLVVSCESTASEAARLAAERAPNLEGFDAVVFAGTDVYLSCELDPSSWPNGCIETPKPSLE